jgi:hypothetical protein
MKQVVKNYSFYPGDFRNNVRPLDIVAQINHDLRKNPGWSIKLMTYLMEDTVCTVVYDVEEVSRSLVESKKDLSFINVEKVKEVYSEDAEHTKTDVISSGNVKVSI